MTQTLNTLPQGCAAVVSAVATPGAMRRRLLDIGLTPGTRVEALYRSCIGDPTAYLVRGSVIALRSADARTIFVTV